MKVVLQVVLMAILLLLTDMLEFSGRRCWCSVWCSVLVRSFGEKKMFSTCCHPSTSPHYSPLYTLVLTQAKFIDLMEKIVTNKNSTRLTKDEGWYSEGEMKTDLNWSQYIS